MSNRTKVLEQMMAREMLKMHPNDALACAWEYFDAEPFTWYGCSDKLNLRTTIEYCDSDNWFGYPEGTVLHFTHIGEVYGTSETTNENGELFGIDPIVYYDHFLIDNHDFELSFEDLERGKILFIPKMQASAEYYIAYHNNMDPLRDQTIYRI